MAMRCRCPPEQFHAAITDRVSNFLRQAVDEITTRRMRSGPYHLIGGRGAAIADVFHDACGRNIDTSCGTTAMDSRKLSCVTRVMFCPSIRMRPFCTS